jgi:DNA-binding XRE family transcriptional regulator
MTLKEFLRINNITQSEFARLLGVTRAYIHCIIKGHYNPSYALAIRISDYSKGSVQVHEIRKCTHTCGKDCLCSKGEET